MSLGKVASVSRRDPLLEKMEKILNRWISEQVDQRKSNVDGVAIREKARSIYDHLAEKEPSGSSPAPGFIASHGWFHRFKQRFSLHNIARTGEEHQVQRVVDEGLIPYKETLRSMEASACQKPITAFFKPSPASHPAKKHSTPATTSCYYTSQAACYSCYTR
ncbi:Tigger transposable element-derived protein 1 [Chionoecetes opilio]|uniref:Tigger transposable element-derived protein 1 n=1 Tax=Chionoecetes opilio TaxID=41210 RepID=A0A8J8WMS8_CHIOP|nr:Tigger transposable element-derived protein 1 [Chionoecetes opilio]